jgi:hypothetical protein
LRCARERVGRNSTARARPLQEGNGKRVGNANGYANKPRRAREHGNGTLIATSKTRNATGGGGDRVGNPPGPHGTSPAQARQGKASKARGRKGRTSAEGDRRGHGGECCLLFIENIGDIEKGRSVLPRVEFDKVRKVLKGLR